MSNVIIAQIEAQRATALSANAHVVDVSASVLYLLRQYLTYDSYYMHVMHIFHSVSFNTASCIYSAIARHIVRTNNNSVSLKESVYMLRSDIRLLVRSCN